MIVLCYQKPGFAPKMYFGDEVDSAEETRPTQGTILLKTLNGEYRRFREERILAKAHVESVVSVSHTFVATQDE